MIIGIDAGDAPACTAKQADRLAAVVALAAAQVEEFMNPREDDALEDSAIEALREGAGLDRDEAAATDPRAAPPPGSPGEKRYENAPKPKQRVGEAEGDANSIVCQERTAKSEREELERVKEIWRQIRPVKKKLADRKYIAAALRGRVHIGKRESKGLRTALAQIERGARSQQLTANSRGLEQRVEQLQHQALTAVAAAPQTLLVLHRLKIEVEKSIERKLRGLRGATAPANPTPVEPEAAVAGTSPLAR